MNSLPEQSGLDVVAFSRTLDKKTTAYKFLWLIALLDYISPADRAPKRIETKKITLRMLRLADVPTRRHRFSYGGSDKIREMLSYFANLEKKEGGNIFEKLDDDEILRRLPLECKEINKHLNRYVSKLWLVPFFEGKRDLPRGNSRVSKIGSLMPEYFFSEPPLPYRFIDGEKTLELHPHWLSYFVRNHEVIRSWAMSRWVSHLQARNPKVSDIATKLASS